MSEPAPIGPRPNTGTLGDSFEAQPDFRPARPTRTPPASPLPEQSLADWATSGYSWETFSAARGDTRAHRSDFESIKTYDGYRPILDALGLEDSDNPFFYPETAKVGIPLVTQHYSRLKRQRGGGSYFDSFTDRAGQEELIAGMIRERRRKDPKFLSGVPDTVAGLRAYFVELEKAKRAEAHKTLDKATGLGGVVSTLAGSITEAMHDPVNLFSLPIGGGGRTVAQVVAREALVNGAIEGVLQPIAADNLEGLGEELTLGEAAANVGIAAVGGGALAGAMHGAAKGVASIASSEPVRARADALADKLFSAMPKRVQDKWGKAIVKEWAGRLAKGEKLEDVFSDLNNRELVTLSRTITGEDNLTPDELAAINVLERSQEIGEASPYQPGPEGDRANETALEVAIRNIEDGLPPEEVIPVPSSRTADVGATEAPAERPRGLSIAPRPQSDVPFDLARYKAKNRRAESSGDDQADNPASSADGRYQITDGTFRDYYKRLFGSDPGKHPPKAVKNNPATQEAIMEALTRDNAAALSRLGEAVNDGNLYLMHFLGSGDGARVFKAPPETPIGRLLSETVLAANPFLRGKSASQVIAWAHGKMGGSSAAIPARAGSSLDPASAEDPRVAQLRAEAMQLEQAAIGSASSSSSGGVPPMYARAFNVDDIVVDAARFQFKGGADEFGVTDRLRGVKEWNPLYAGRVVVWEAADGKIFLADGHQRHGLARRIQAESGETIRMDAIVLREGDGISAEQARVYAALKNIAEGTGTAVDAAKVIRDAGADVLKHLPPKSALVRDGGALARLSDDAFGAVYNEVIPADFAAVIGHLLPDRPDAHGAMVELLAKLDPANRGQAESIVRQGMAAGLHRETQVELFGERELVSSLMLERAKVLEKGLARLRKHKLVHGTAAKEAETLEKAGSKIARERSAKEAKASGEAVEIVSRLAFSRGPVADALNVAARDLAAGGRLGSVVDRFVADVLELDLPALGRAAPDDDLNRLVPDGAGRGGDAGEAGEAVSPQPNDPGEPGLFGLEQPTAAELAVATERFSDPDGPAVREQADSLVHDFKAHLEPEPDDFEVSAEIEDLLDAESILFHALDEFAVKKGLDLDFEYDGQLQASIDEIAKLLSETNNVDAAVKRVLKDLESGKLRTIGREPELAEPVDMGKSTVVPEPEQTLKASDYAGDYIDPAEAKARVREWKREAVRIGKESPPPENHVILSLFDASGTWSQPYRDMGYKVIQLDLKHGHDLLQDMGQMLIAIDELKARGAHIAGVIAQPPCTTFAGSGARWWDPRHNRNWSNAVRRMWGGWAAKEFDSPLEYNQYLVAATEEYIARSAPDFFVIENPVGRIEEKTGLPKPLLAVQPHNFGDAYTKRTHLWGKFNPELPTANVDPVEGSKIHKLRGKDEKDEGLRSLTPEGFAYAFALANRPGTEPGVSPGAGADRPLVYFQPDEISDVKVELEGSSDAGDFKVETAALPGGGFTYGQVHNVGYGNTGRGIANNSPFFETREEAAAAGIEALRKQLAGGSLGVDDNAEKFAELLELAGGATETVTPAAPELPDPPHPVTGEPLSAAIRRADELRASFPPAREGELPGTHNIRSDAPAPDGGTRGELRERIVAKLLEGEVTQGREAHLILGPPAAGKSTIAEPLAASRGARIIDSDDAKAMLPEFDNGIGAGAVHEESAKLAAEAVSRAMDSGDNLVLPVVGKTAEGVEARIAELELAGYQIHLHLVDLPGDKALERAIGRYGETGRLVDPAYIRSVGNKPLETFEQMVATYQAKLKGFSHVSNDVPFGEKPRILKVSDDALAEGLGFPRAESDGRGGGSPGEGAGPDTAGAAQENVSGLDLGPAADPSIAARQRQEVDLRANSPLRPGNVDARGELGLELFDKANQPTFRLDDDGAEISAEDLLAELDADEAAIKAMRDCL